MSSAKINIEDVIRNKQIFDQLKHTLIEHASFMNVLETKLFILYDLYPEIIRIAPTSRVKSIPSIVDKLNKWNKERKSDEEIICLNNFISNMEKISDLAENRITIATKDQYNEIDRLIKYKFKTLGNIKKTKNLGCEGKFDENGYSANHYLLTKRNSKVKCEIQVRTLTQDLWSVFSHYESYKKSTVTNVKKKDLENYAKLMDVSDEYAQAIRAKKIQDANEYHYQKCKAAKNYDDENILNANDLHHFFYVANNIGNKATKNPLKIDVFLICSLLMELSEYKIFLKKDLEALMENDVYMSQIKEEVIDINKANKSLQNKKQIEDFDIYKLCGILKENKIFRINSLTELNQALQIKKVRQQLIHEYQKLTNNGNGEKQMDMINAFKILCECYSLDRENYESKNLDSRNRSRIHMLVKDWYLQKNIQDQIEEFEIDKKYI